MNNRFIKTLFVIVIASILPASFENSVFATKYPPYQHTMVKEEIQKKGGSIKPLRKPRYKILVVKYAVTEQVIDFVESRVKETLRKILHKEKAKSIYDGITVFLYRNAENANTGNTTPMARAEWWPKGHSFSLDNTENIADKSTYIEKYDISSLPKKPKSIIDGFSVSKRKEIYKEIEAAEEASLKQAKAHHSKYDEKFYDEIDKLDAIAKSKILKKHNISDGTYNKIIVEGINQHW